MKSPVSFQSIPGNLFLNSSFILSFIFMLWQALSGQNLSGGNFNLQSDIDSTKSLNKDYKHGMEKFELAQFDSAIYYFKKAENEFRQKKSINEMISAQIRLAEVCCDKASYDSMWTLIEKVKNQINNNNPVQESLLFDLSTLLTGIYVIFAQPDSARFYLNEASKYLNTIKDPSLITNYYYQSGQFFKLLYDFDKANKKLDSAVQIYQYTSKINVAKCYALKQRIAYLQKDYDGQRLLLEHITAILDELKIENHPLRAKVLEGYGSLNLDKSGLNTDKEGFIEVNDYFKKSYLMFKKFYGEYHPEIATAYNQLGVSSSSLNYDSLELDYHSKSLKIRTKLFGADNYNTSFSYTNLGNYYNWKAKKIDSAGYYYEKAVNIRIRVLGLKHPKLANAYLKLSDLYINKNIEIAYKYAHLALCTAHPTFNDTAHIFNNPVIGDFYSHETFLALRLKASILDGWIHLENTKYPLVFLFEKAIECVRKIDTLITNGSKKGFNMNETMLGDRSLYFMTTLHAIFKLYTLTGDTKYCNEAFEFTDKYKAAQLNIEMNLQKLKQDSVMQLCKKLKNESFNLQKKLAIEKLSETEKSKIKQRYLLFQDSITEMETKLIKKYPGNLYQSSSNSLINVQKLLKPNEAIISYSILTTNIYILLISKDTVLMNVDLSKSFSSAIETFITFAGSKQDYSSLLFNNVAFELYTILFPLQVNEILNKKNIANLILIPDKSLWFLPFEALLTEKVNEETSDFDSLPYLIKKYRINLAPSFYFAYQSLERNNQEKYKKDILLVAPVFDNLKTAGINDETRSFINNLSADSSFNSEKLVIRGNIVPLPYSETEIKSIDKLFLSKRFKPEILLREKATFKNISTKPLDYRIVHFASHAYANTLNPDLSGILLSSENSQPDNILFGGQIKNMEIKADLVVLSACETGLGKVITGEGINNLSRSFALSKVPNVISSLWKVSDQSTSELMIDFYKDLLKHRFSSYSESLYSAKLKMIQEGKYAQPFYWAPFVLTRY